jgi:hypothetical protein
VNRWRVGALQPQFVAHAQRQLAVGAFAKVELPVASRECYGIDRADRPAKRYGIEAVCRFLCSKHLNLPYFARNAILLGGRRKSRHGFLAFRLATPFSQLHCSGGLLH